MSNSPDPKTLKRVQKELANLEKKKKKKNGGVAHPQVEAQMSKYRELIARLS
jgi:hypothetical protein